MRELRELELGDKMRELRELELGDKMRELGELEGNMRELRERTR